MFSLLAHPCVTVTEEVKHHVKYLLRNLLSLADPGSKYLLHLRLGMMMMMLMFVHCFSRWLLQTLAS